MSLSFLEPRNGRTTTDVIKFALWPFAVMMVLNRVLVRAVNGDITDDFNPVYKAALAFLNRQPVYTANFDSVDPHYLYPPGATMLLSPIAVIDPERSRWLFILASTIAIIAALYILLRIFGYGLNSVAAPALLLAAFASETVTNTLVFTNFNGFVLLGEIAFVYFLLKRKDLTAGVAIGLTIVVKPILVPLLIIPLMTKQWKVFVTAAAIPLVFTAIAWPLSVDPMDFVRRTVPYLLESRDYFNSAIVGNGRYYGLPEWMIFGLRGVLGVMVLVSLWILYRYCREDRLFFIATTSGLVLTAHWLLGSLGQMYYSMMLFPLLMTVVLKNSVLRNWPAWLAIYGFMSYDRWLSGRFYTTGRAFDYMRTTFGWSLLIIVIFGVLVGRYFAARSDGRLDRGIEPEWIEAENRRIDAEATTNGDRAAKTARATESY
ncbi:MULTISPECIES: glycosyltransferase family 87 protein [unclassified Rhodococcus (in: high G+C Gram-positive bacteria)]|uniref:glycosyltransferase family 87 protein n=1 Tax=unclassified Rhodococcus (in: high G+C Gram-positive bacteria) TaxID=192944 RepID=UPI0027E1FFA9|nr:MULTISPECIES: glycosyltransferase family 87 protein [unclassified Rhodococcus (in: high G+C Gram-positive bacteria)]